VFNQAVIKLNRLCNLACDYCYYINDQTEKPGLKVSAASIEVFLDKFATYLRKRGVMGSISFHGGEPLLMGVPFFERVLSHECFISGQIRPAIQTNGTKLTDDFIELFKKHRVSIGVSIDGTKEAHDQHRKFVGGRGSYDLVLKNISRLRENDIPVGVLCVASPEHDGQSAFLALKDAGLDRIDVLLPLGNHESEGIDQDFKNGIERYLIGFFGEWLTSASDVRVRMFDTMFARSLGNDVEHSSIGNVTRDKYLVLETDGLVHHDEDFFVPEFRGTPYQAFSEHLVNISSFEEFEVLVDTHMQRIGVKDLGVRCASCEVGRICKGGIPASRFSNEDGFQNPSIYCKALFSVSSHIKRLVS